MVVVIESFSSWEKQFQNYGIDMKELGLSEKVETVEGAYGEFISIYSLEIPERYRIIAVDNGYEDFSESWRGLLVAVNFKRRVVLIFYGSVIHNVYYIQAYSLKGVIPL